MNYKIIGKYIKDLNFSIPNPKVFFSLSKDIANYKINIDIKSSQISEKIVEIQTTLNLSPVKENFEKIEAKIIYSTIIELSESILDKKKLEKVILIEIPTKIYPELRKIFVFMFENSGFNEIKINESVDFQKLYNLQQN
jgi:preprotein translocase subunit SecB